MNRIGFLVAAAASACLSTAAFAANVVPSAPYAPSYVAPVPVSWTGFYVGANLGYGFGHADSSTDLGLFGSLDGSGNLNGAVGGGTVGYNYQIGSFVVGIEGDLDFGSLKGSGSQDFTILGILPGTASQSASLDWFGTVRGRLGYDLNGWLPYVTGGWAMGKASVSGNATVIGIPIASYADSHSVSGFVYGAGLERRIGANWSAKVEYLHFNFGSFDTNVDTLLGSTTVSTNVDADLVRVGLNYRF